MPLDFDVIVIGGGHAGAEAASAAARLDARVLVLTSNLETIGQMSCNPAIGGVAKGTVVREVDALGGVMGRAADRSTIQFRMLNRSKGPAVWAPRAQCDRVLYRRAVRSILEEYPNVRFHQATAGAFVLEHGRVCGVETLDGRRFTAGALILTAGTFLRGRIHMGLDTRIPAGRAGDAPAVAIAEQLEALGLTVGRFKTGTPPRIDGRTVDYAELDRQDGELPEYRFSSYRREARPAQVPCWITWAGEAVKSIINNHLHESALYGGAISSKGPRYCPSVEDKVVKFPEAERHQVFLEPEGLDTAELYVNGLSTSLPATVQEAMLHAVPGLRDAVMTRPGYAIEYDFYDPRQLTPWLEVRALEGLFFAGQINGTTGYEEAAGQGLVAGINAVRRIRGQEPVLFSRDSGYLGVLVDDLITRGVDEPYRLFTSRAEFRLLLRQDNAVKRLGPLAAGLGMLTSGEGEVLSRRLAEEESLIKAARATRSSGQLVADLVRRPGVGLRAMLELTLAQVASDEAWASAEIELKYEGYLARERDAAAKLAELANFVLPVDIPYAEISSLSIEARQKLNAAKPRSLAQAGRIPGVSPSDLQNLVFEVVRRRSVAA